MLYRCGYKFGHILLSRAQTRPSFWHNTLRLLDVLLCAGINCHIRCHFWTFHFVPATTSIIVATSGRLTLLQHPLTPLLGHPILSYTLPLLDVTFHSSIHLTFSSVIVLDHLHCHLRMSLFPQAHTYLSRWSFFSDLYAATSGCLASLRIQLPLLLVTPLGYTLCLFWTPFSLCHPPTHLVGHPSWS